MSTPPEDPSELPDISTGAAEASPKDWHNDPLLQDQEDVDPDDEDAEGEPTGFSEADVDPDDDSAEDDPDAVSEQDGA